jgi:hypothetical protein
MNALNDSIVSCVVRDVFASGDAPREQEHVKKRQRIPSEATLGTLGIAPDLARSLGHDQRRRRKMTLPVTI